MRLKLCGKWEKYSGECCFLLSWDETAHLVMGGEEWETVELRGVCASYPTSPRNNGGGLSAG